MVFELIYCIAFHKTTEKLKIQVNSVLGTIKKFQNLKITQKIFFHLLDGQQNILTYKNGSHLKILKTHQRLKQMLNEGKANFCRLFLLDIKISNFYHHLENLILHLKMSSHFYAVYFAVHYLIGKRTENNSTNENQLILFALFSLNA